MSLENLITEAIRKCDGDSKIGLLYSGGIDSSIIARILKDNFDVQRIILVSVGVEESYDSLNASKGAQELELSLYPCVLDLRSVKFAIRKLIELNIVENAGEISIAIPLFLGMQFLSQRLGTKTVYLGQGADELFGGYRKYSILISESKMIETDSMMKSDLYNLLNRQKVMETQIATHFEIELIYPFLYPKVIEYAQNIPISDHFILEEEKPPVGKAILRNLVDTLGMSENISGQPKKALQYGSGTKKLVKQISKEAGYSKLSNWFESLI